MVSIESPIFALIEEGNPIPDPHAASETIDPADYLATLQTRSSEVTQLDERTTKEEKKPNRWLIGLAAAALIVVVCVMAVVLNQGSEETPPAETTPAPTTTADTTEPETGASGWEALPVFRFGLEETARIAGFEPGFAATVPNGWSVDDPGSDVQKQFDREPSDEDNLELGIDVVRLDETDVASIVDLLTDATKFEATEPTDVVVGGAEGVTLVITPFETETLTRFSVATNLGVFPLPAGQEQRIYLLDVAGQTVAFLAHTTSPIDEEENLQTIIDSIVWRDLTD